MGDGASTPPTPSAKVSAIFIYPVKSCRGISVSHAPLIHTGKKFSFFSFFHNNFASLFVYSAVCILIVLSNVTGFRWDRQWMVVNPQGRMYTQRVEPKLALVEVELPPEAFLENWEPTQDSYMGRLHKILP